jgi:hypothetical protein
MKGLFQCRHVTVFQPNSIGALPERTELWIESECLKSRSSRSDMAIHTPGLLERLCRIGTTTFAQGTSGKPSGYSPGSLDLSWALTSRSSSRGAGRVFSKGEK